MAYLKDLWFITKWAAFIMAIPAGGSIAVLILLLVFYR